ncbi:ProQ/FinO family protein [Cupriavidus sp. CuC1]|uniref:ProQ/FinO family protein n=1 Tax=Cupriavidus sp. CuC1 TaxID=3373131 RepID=UPI0037D06C42
MGFEQLAALKAQLAQQAKPKPAVKPSRPRPSAQAAQSKPVDPVVRNIGRLQKRFPLAFPKNPAPKRALKVGIFDDLLGYASELGLQEAELREAIKTWCRGTRYKACLTEGAARVDLNGAEAGSVTQAEATRFKK